ncbi:MAG: DNA repair exonuclease [SAR324 cluster bacterium]|nr:DNA repair exonuclease [SAR324 cluster bacterium]
MSTKAPLRIAHASDIHLDTDYFGGEENLPSRDYCRGVFGNLLECIKAQAPQLLMLPGDLFDSNRASLETILWAMEALAALPFTVVMIPGNHDCLEPRGIFLEHDFARLPNVDMLLSPQGESRDFPELQAFVWGKGMEDHCPEYRPLEGLPAPRADRWNLAMGHGIYVGNEGNRYRSSPVEKSQIANSGYDYIALGHHHALLNVSQNGTAAFYCGAPIPISKESQGTFLTVQLQEGQAPDVTIHNLD